MLLRLALLLALSGSGATGRVTDSFAFGVFIAIFSGGLALLTIGMVWITLVLVRRNRRKP